MSKILVVDDIALCREPIAEALRHHGHEVLCAASGPEALATVQKHRPDLILLDLNMPGMDGLTTLSALRERSDSKTVPVLLLTDRSDREAVVEAGKHGVQGYLLKSRFSIQDLFDRVDKSLGGTASAAVNRTASTAAGGRLTPTPAGPRTPPTSAPTSCPSRGAERRPSATTTRDEPHAKIVSTATGDQLLAHICKNLELKPLGLAVQNVMAATSNAACSADDVARAAAPDQALCIRLLRVANSSAYNRGRAAHGVREAVQRMGIQEVRQLVMTLEVLETYSNADHSGIDERLFWEHSLACGLIASAIAKARQVKTADDYFLWGVLHDVGRLILLAQIPERYMEVWNSAQESGEPLEKVETNILALNHCDVLAKALEHWKFAHGFIVPVTSHHLSARKLDRLGHEHRDAAATLALANRLAHSLSLGNSGNETVYPLDEFVDLLHLHPETIPQIASAVPSEVDDLKLTMLARTNVESWPIFATQLQGRLTKPVRPLCVSSCPETNAYRLFFERIACASPGNPPNLGVVHLRDEASQAEVVAKFKAAERDSGAGDTPVLLFCDQGNSEQEWLRTRQHRVLSAPASIASILAAVEDLITTDR